LTGEQQLIVAVGALAAVISVLWVAYRQLNKDNREIIEKANKDNREILEKQIENERLHRTQERDAFIAANKEIAIEFKDAIEGFAQKLDVLTKEVRTSRSRTARDK